MNENEVVQIQKEISVRYDALLAKFCTPQRALLILDIKAILCKVIATNYVTADELDNILDEFKEINALARKYTKHLQPKPSHPPQSPPFSRN